VKLQLKGVRFDTIEGIQKAVNDQLNKISAQDIYKVMQKLETRVNLGLLKKCVRWECNGFKWLGTGLRSG
jgi:hypothetical protein